MRKLIITFSQKIKTRWKETILLRKKQCAYGAQNEAYMSRSAEKWVRGLCFNKLGMCG